ncbi:DUF4870 domain-containing protein [Pontibacter harenae]|uniref:DUF4870 domain-containing protein n=1 Tax=Pontibacter harenae TaxID=2894083 RepID=UPI001E3A8F33|nr:helix-turn-helix domain-containing protein [Pontibacter harenae]
MTLADKIVADRKSKGFLQEELAERAKVSLRTIQRIEKGDSIPRGYTLQAIAGALGKPTEEFASFALEQPVATNSKKITAATKGTTDEETAIYLQLINFSSLAYLVFPYLNVVLPIVLWRKKRQVQEVNEVGKKIINFQILWTVALHVALLLMLLFQMLMTFYFKTTPGFGLLTVFFIMYLLNAPAIVIASSKLKKGNYDIYPFRLNIF